MEIFRVTGLPFGLMGSQPLKTDKNQYFGNRNANIIKPMIIFYREEVLYPEGIIKNNMCCGQRY
jgi:hypothetical protein